MNFYNFDYRLVLTEDPDYERFVDKELFWPDNLESVEEEPASVLRRKEGTEAENDIIDFVHDGSAAPSNTCDERHGPHYDPEQEVPSEPTEVVTLKEEYENPPNPNFDPSILALPPPNRFLLAGSRVWRNDDTMYQFDRSSSRNARKFISSLQTYRFSQSGNKIRLTKATYRFDRKQNVTSEIRKNFYMIIYNTETKQLYRLRNKRKSNRKSSRFQRKLENIFNILPHAYSHISYAPKKIQNKFINAITEAAVKDIPELVILDSNDADYPTLKTFFNNFELKVPRGAVEVLRLIAVILQHKVGQPMPWLNLVLVQNMWDIMSDIDYYKRILSGPRLINEQVEDIKRIRRKTVFKLVPNLRKSNHMKTAIKTLLGEYHYNFFLRLFNTIRLESFLSNWVSCAYRDLIRKNIHHWLVQSINTNDIPLLRDVMSIINSTLEHLLRRGSHGQTISEQEAATIDSYIKICQRLISGFKSHDPADLNKSKFLAWHTWQDLFDMADELGIRIRPNQFRNVLEVRKLHDRLALIIRRDRNIMLKYEDVIFDEFVNPDKEYDGFRFIQLRTAEELRNEGTVMHHCVASYASKCAEGRSIIFSMRKDDKSYVTIDLSPTTYEVVQQYTLHDIIITSQTVLDLIEKWQADCLELHKNEKETYYEKCSKKEKINQLRAKIDNLKTVSTEGVVEDGKYLLSQIHRYENELKVMLEPKLPEAVNA